jgi:hypothetical protein
MQTAQECRMGNAAFPPQTSGMRSQETVAEAPEISQKIHIIRGQRVLLDSDLAVLYGVTTKVFKQAVRRYIQRFPEDFLLTLTNQEVASLRSQIVTLKDRSREAQQVPEHGIYRARRSHGCHNLEQSESYRDERLCRACIC